MTDPRETALFILQKILENDGFSIINSSLSDEEKDNAFVTMLVLTALRNLVYIRKTLKTYINKKLSSQNIICQCALILGSTELLYMQTPDYAAINSYVNIVKFKTDKFAAGFVNAVLRKISQNKNEITTNDTHEFFPQSFRMLLRQSYSTKTIAKLEQIAKQEPLLDISSKNLNVAQKLQGRTLPLGTIRLDNKGRISQLPDYDEGTWWVQDFSSSIAIKVLDNPLEKKVLELCAAPGGKTAQLLNAGAKVTCLDISQERLNTLTENLKRLKLEPEKIICADGLEYLKQNKELFDIVVLDAPCSATGTIRRHPEIVHLKTIEDVKKQASLQSKFLELVDSSLNNDGVLLYCTCSLCKEEGELQINDFLSKHPQYKIIDLHSKIPSELNNIVTTEGFIRILPHHLAPYGGADGFFVACLQKEK